jgi:hypothetical protein
MTIASEPSILKIGEQHRRVAMSYEAFILLPPNSAASLEQAEVRLLNFYKNNERSVKTQRYEKKLDLIIDGWICHIYLNRQPHVLAESKEMAETFASDRADKIAISGCDRRFEIICQPDPDLDYFNDYLFVLEELGSLDGAKTWEGITGKFL